MLFKSRLKYYVFLSIIFFSWSNLTYASLEINEIMYSPESGSDYEWVEIYNNGSTSIDLNKYRFFHGENSGPITLKNGDNAILQPLKYFIVAKSLADYSWLDFSDMVFSSSVLSLPDSGDNTYIAISDPNKIIINDVTYNVSNGGSKASKNSLSKINGEWVSGIPTPGKDNKNTINLDDEEETVGNINETNSVVGGKNLSSNNSSIDPKELEVFKITTKIISPKIAMVGVPFSFSSLTTTNRGETYAVGRFIWNFGDGMVIEAKESGPFEYTYEYEGEYSMSLSYFNSYFDKEPTALNKIIIKVFPADIFISSVGDETSPYVEIDNKSKYETDLSNWVVVAGTHYFKIPEGMSLLSGKKVKLSPKITGFNSEDIKSVYITNQNKEIIAKYPIEIKKLLQKNTSFTKIINKNLPQINDLKEDNLFKDSDVINLNDLAASASGSNTEIQSSTYAIVGLVIIIGIGIASFVLIRKKNEVSDYIEKELKPEDMTIIE